MSETKVCVTCHQELPLSAFERNSRWLRNTCRQCRNATGRRGARAGKPVATHQPGYESLLGAILDLAVLDYHNDKPRPKRVADTPSVLDGEQWDGFVVGPTEVMDCLRADDEVMTYFRAVDTSLTPEEIRDTFIRFRLQGAK